MAAAAVTMGGNVRVGLEDNLYLSKGVLATNGQLVEKVINIINLMGGRVLTPDETRKKLSWRKFVRSLKMQVLSDFIIALSLIKAEFILKTRASTTDNFHS